jgi:hypothetical protein
MCCVLKLCSISVAGTQVEKQQEKEASFLKSGEVYA